MSRPSSYHGDQRRDTTDDFSLPLFVPALQQPQYTPSGAQQVSSQQQQQLQHTHQPSHGGAFPPPRLAAPPRSPNRLPPLSAAVQQQQQQHQSHRHSLSLATTHLNIAGGPGGATVAGAGYPPSAYSNGNGSSSTVGPLSAVTRQNMHFPAPFVTTGYPDDIQPNAAGGGAGGSALGSLARSASLGTARRKDPFSYPSDDVESGMAGDQHIPQQQQAYHQQQQQQQQQWGGYGSSNLQPTLHQPQYVNTSRGAAVDNDVLMSPGRYNQPPASMPPPPLPPLRTAQLSNQHQQFVASAASVTPSTMQQQPSAGGNPYLPRGTADGGAGAGVSGPGSVAPPSDAWLSYRRNSAASDSVSPLGASPHSPGLMAYDPSPHLLTPQGTSNNLTSSPRQPYPPAGSPSRPSSQYVSGHRSQSFAASQPVTPSGRYEPMPSSSRGRDVSGSSLSSSSRHGFRPVRDWSDLKPAGNSHAQGRRADPDVPGGFMSPLKCLTSALPQTYTLCNPTFKYESTDNPRRVLTKPSKPVYNDGADNEDWDYILFVNDVLGGEHGGDRYLILDVLGQGTFGQVVKCQNMRTHNICAVKVVKNKPAYLNQSKMEVAILNLLNRDHDPRDEHHILRMYDSFTHKNHLCLVFECLSSNLYELIKQNQFKGLSLQLVRVFTQQLLECLAVLKEARLIHCDLKPENILLKSLQSPQIKVIDFGSACHELQTVYTYIQSRFYRSPEVLLGLPYSCAIDMWSLGCIVVELFLGLPIFPGTSEYNQVSRITDMLGLPPQHLLEMGKQTNEFFNYVGVDAHGRKQYKLKPMEQYATEHRTKESPSKQYFKQTKLDEIILEYPYSKKNVKQSDIDKEMSQRRAFINFVQGLLHLDPMKRWTPMQAAKHPFISGEKYTGPYEPQSVPTKRTTATSSSSTTAATTPTTPSSKKYGGLVQSPSSSRGQRVYSDAAAYNHQLNQHQYQTAQVAAAQNAVRPGPFSPGYDPQQSSYTKPRVSSHHGQPPTWHQPMAPPAQQHPLYHIPSGPQQQVRPNIPIINAPTNPPPNSYFPASRNRANTINQMDTIPPALARLTNLGAPDPSGNRSSLTPVLHREDMAEAWERRQQGGSQKHSNMQTVTYPQLEFLQEQAELVNLGQQGYVMPGQYHGMQLPSNPAVGHHRSTQSFSGTQAYQMQPGIGHPPQDYRGRVPPHSLQPTSDYDPPASSSRSFLPTFPPPAATTTHQGQVQPGGSSFDGFDSREASMNLMYTPLQPTPAGQYGYSSGHSSRASYSGPYGQPPIGTGQQQQQQQRNNPFAPGQVPQNPNSPARRYGGGGYGAA